MKKSLWSAEFWRCWRQWQLCPWCPAFLLKQRSQLLQWSRRVVTAQDVTGETWLALTVRGVALVQLSTDRPPLLWNERLQTWHWQAPCCWFIGNCRSSRHLHHFLPDFLLNWQLELIQVTAAVGASWAYVRSHTHTHTHTHTHARMHTDTDTQTQTDTHTHRDPKTRDVDLCYVLNVLFSVFYWLGWQWSTDEHAHCCCCASQFTSCLCAWNVCCRLWNCCFSMTYPLHTHTCMHARIHTLTHALMHTGTHTETHFLAHSSV